MSSRARALEQLQAARQIHLQAGEIPGVHTDERRVGGQGAIQANLVVNLDQGIQPSLARRFDQATKIVPQQCPGDEEHRIGTDRARLPDLVVAHHKVLAQHGQPERRDLTQVVVGAPEARRLGEDRERARSAGNVRLRHPEHLSDVRERPSRRRRALHLRDHRKPVGVADRRFVATRRRHPRHLAPQLAQGGQPRVSTGADP